MNIFALDYDPVLAAQYQADKHVVKMITESCQMLSTAHRVLDGHPFTHITDSGRSIKRWHFTDNRNDHLYKASHVNHPCNIWVRECDGNYNWLFFHACELSRQYTLRYDKIHACDNMLRNHLNKVPDNIRLGRRTEFAQAMPPQYRDPDPVYAYRLFYIHDKSRFAKWKLGNVPSWFAEARNESMARNDH